MAKRPTTGPNGLPSLTASNGRTAGGQFGPGNTFGGGNPHAKRINELRRAMFEAVTLEDTRDVIALLIREAKAGKPWAVREFLTRAVGCPPKFADLVQAEDRAATEALLAGFD